MTSLYERYPELLDTPPDWELKQVVADLDMVGRLATASDVPSHRDQAIRQALRDHARGSIGADRSRRGTPWQRLRGFRLASALTAALIVIAGFAGYARLQSPATASAAAVLHRAAFAMMPPAGDVVHERTTYVGEYPIAPDTGSASLRRSVTTTEQWNGFAPDGSLDRSDLTIVLDGQLEERDVHNAKGYWFYSAKGNSVTVSPTGREQFKPPTDSAVWPKTIMTLPENRTAIRDVLLNAAKSPDTQLLPQQTIDGRRLDVIQLTHEEPKVVNGSPANLPPFAASTYIFTVYIDASSYVLYRVDELDLNARGSTVGRGSVRVTTYETLPPSRVPAGIFQFTPPPGSSVMRCNSALPPVCTSSGG